MGAVSSAATEARKLILGGLFAVTLAAAGGYAARAALASRADWAPGRFEVWQGPALSAPGPTGLVRGAVQGTEDDGMIVWGSDEPPFQRLAWAKGHEPTEFEDILGRDLGKAGLALSGPEALTVQGHAARHRTIDVLNLHMTTWSCDSGRAMLLIVRAGPEADPDEVRAWNQHVLDGVSCE